MGKRHHRLPFGAEIEQAGVRFRLWAPAAEAVELLLYDGGAERAVGMSKLEGGWHEVLTRDARAGSRYRYRINGELAVPDPASRSNPDDVAGPSMVIDPASFEWNDDGWRGPPWHEAVVYELHVGTFTREGTFRAAEAHLDHLVRLGVNVIEIMPVADFPGRWGWGYDGVLPYAPDASYGTPEDLKHLVAAAHKRGLAVILDVVYNHFGPEGNYLHAYAPQFFTDRHQTPWGAAINFDGEDSRAVRDFFIHNALYWLEEYHFDGLRFDAVHAIIDDSEPHIMEEIASRLRTGPGRSRPVYLVLENAANHASLLGAPGAPDKADAQWNDDAHHCFHVILTGESDGYYADYADQGHRLLARCLAEGYAYQGEISPHEGGEPRGEPSGHLPPTAFVPFLQNHDQIGNRARGERLAHLVDDDDALHAATAILLLAPSPPLLYMGEEWAAPEPFPYFCDFGPELLQLVREGRRREFARFEKFRDDAVWATVPDPGSIETFRAAQLHWENLGKPRHAEWLERYRRLLELRRREIVPLVPRIRERRYTMLDGTEAFTVEWALDDGSVLHLTANLTSRPVPTTHHRAGRLIFSTAKSDRGAAASQALAPWSVTWMLESSRAGQ